jgi:hypothetical protein
MTNIGKIPAFTEDDVDEATDLFIKKLIRRTDNEKKFYYSQEAIYQKKLDEMQTCEEKVAYLMHRNAHLRECDRCLLKAYELQVDNYDGSLDKSIIHKLTPKESITRARRKLQELGILLPIDDDVVEARHIAAEAMKDWSTTK